MAPADAKLKPPAPTASAPASATPAQQSAPAKSAAKPTAPAPVAAKPAPKPTPAPKAPAEPATQSNDEFMTMMNRAVRGGAPAAATGQGADDAGVLRDVVRRGADEAGHLGVLPGPRATLGDIGDDLVPGRR